MESLITIDKLCRHLLKILHTRIRVYDLNLKQSKVYGDQDGQPDPLKTDPIFEEMLLTHAEQEKPYIHIEMGEVLYGVLKGEEYIIVGPYCYAGNTAHVSEELKYLHHMEKTEVYKVNKGEKELFDECILMFHECISDRQLDVETMYLENSSIHSFEEKMIEGAVQIAHEYREEEQLHNPYGQELREQEAIRTGNIVLLRESRAEIYEGKLGTLSQNPIRNRKNIGIAVIAVSVRSAIAGGVNPERALTFSDAAIQKLESVNSVPEIDRIIIDAQLYLTRMVHEIKCRNKAASGSPLVEETKQLIMKYLHQKITAAMLAKQLKVSTSGLYKAFLREEKMSVTDYILHEKINASKQRLMYSEDSYGEIAADYGFVSQSHYGQNFKKITGMTPGEFRRKYGRSNCAW